MNKYLVVYPFMGDLRAVDSIHVEHATLDGARALGLQHLNTLLKAANLQTIKNLPARTQVVQVRK